MTSDHAWMLAIALVIDVAVGDPPGLWRRVAHPAALLGRAIGLADHHLNRPDLASAIRRGLGLAAILALVGIAAAVGVLVEQWLARVPFGWLGTVLAASVLLAGRGLHDHVAAVADAFATGGIAEARTAVAHIVGRDPASLDRAGICRAAIESAAENFSDAMVAPAFWFLVLGLPGMLAYKAINTADSMIGHKTRRHEDFGRASARLDDLANLLPARLAGALIAAAAPFAGGSSIDAFKVMWRDARRHRSPNAGWPEAAMAGALDLALAGPRRYGSVQLDEPYLNADSRREAVPADIRRALKVYGGAWAALIMAVVVLAIGTLVLG